MRCLSVATIPLTVSVFRLNCDSISIECADGIYGEKERVGLITIVVAVYIHFFSRGSRVCLSVCVYSTVWLLCECCLLTTLMVNMAFSHKHNLTFTWQCLGVYVCGWYSPHSNQYVRVRRWCILGENTACVSACAQLYTVRQHMIHTHTHTHTWTSDGEQVVKFEFHTERANFWQLTDDTTRTIQSEYSHYLSIDFRCFLSKQNFQFP